MLFTLTALNNPLSQIYKSQLGDQYGCLSTAWTTDESWFDSQDISPNRHDETF